MTNLNISESSIRLSVYSILLIPGRNPTWNRIEWIEQIIDDCFFNCFFTCNFVSIACATLTSRGHDPGMKFHVSLAGFPNDTYDQKKHCRCAGLEFL
jgi:hypothetical protein